MYLLIYYINVPMYYTNTPGKQVAGDQGKHIIYLCIAGLLNHKYLHKKFKWPLTLSASHN